MPNYDFRSLSPIDFEDLIRDLLRRKLAIHLERFASGPDEGIDLRGRQKGKLVIIQCKHYADSSFSHLLSVLRTKEKHKLRTLKPGRYILATSLALSPARKKKIIEVLRPFVRATADVLGRDDVNGLLTDFPEAEETNFKLWLTSSAVLKRVLHNATAVQTEIQIKKISNKIPLYVQNRSFPSARKLLEQFHFVIISGIPGIGKTTLAELLLYAYMERGFKPVFIRDDPKEAFSVYEPGAKTIFYYDDFLGQTQLGDSGKANQDSALLDLIELARRSNNVRLLMTTREYILRQAIVRSERFHNSTALHQKYILKLEDYTKYIRARILFNHLYFSKLPRQYLTNVLSTKSYHEIIAHPNYTPRIIEWMTDPVHLNGIDANDYSKFFLDNLDKPSRLWDHAYSKHISQSGRDLLHALFSLEGYEDHDRLRAAFQAMRNASAERHNLTTSANDYRDALQELESSFIEIDQYGVGFLNPSLRDYLQYKSMNDPDVYTTILLGTDKLEQVKTLLETFLVERPDLSRSVLKPFVAAALRLVSKQIGEERVEASELRLEIELLSSLLARHSEDRVERAIQRSITRLSADDLSNFRAWADVVLNLNRLSKHAPDLDRYKTSILRKLILQLDGMELHFDDFTKARELKIAALLPSKVVKRLSDRFEDYCDTNFEDDLDQLSVSSQLESFKRDLLEQSRTWRRGVSDLIRQVDARIEAFDEEDSQSADERYEAWKDEQAFAEKETQTVDRMFDMLRD